MVTMIMIFVVFEGFLFSVFFKKNFLDSLEIDRARL